MSRRVLSFRFIATFVLTVGLLSLGFLNVQQKRIYVPPEDGCAWVEVTPGVIVATVVEPDGAAYRSGVRVGDVLKRINDRPVVHDRDVARTLYEVGVWSKVRYSLERDNAPFDATVIVSPPSDRALQRQLYLELIGLVYFLAGLFVVLRRSSARYSQHFYFVCLSAFTLFVFRSTGKLNDFDWTIFWFDLAAYIFLPAMFLHFCLRFPIERPWIQGRRYLAGLLYLPAAGLLAAWIGFVTGALTASPSIVALRNLLDTFNDAHFGLLFTLAAVVLAHTYRTVQAPELRHQMKWVTRGTAAAIVPYVTLQQLPRFLGIVPPPAADAAVFSLVLLPVAFGYAIHRYRLMDVDIIFKAGVAYTLATASVVGLYATFIALVAEILGSGGTWARVAATIVAAMLFTPIKDQIQVWLDKVFYRERYGLRRTLSDFGRTLGSEVRSEQMLDRVLDRLSRSLLVSRMAVFVEDCARPGVFVPGRTVGVSIPAGADFSFLSNAPAGSHVFFENEIHDLHYFIPCRVKDQIIAYLGLGRTDNGDYLTTEDLELLDTLSDYIGVALENARLYRSLEDRAAEYQNLKDFSENIVESIGVGVVVENLEQRIVGWNRALEQLTGKARQDVLGQPTAAIIPEHLLRFVREDRFVYKQPWGDLTVTLSATPLLDKFGAPRGNLIIVDDITEQSRLEDQLVQNEKLTSIGLLAAGVAHEVNTPLAVISNYTQMLRKEMSPEDSRSKLLEKITRQTFRASEIVNGLLNFSRTSPTEFGEVDLHQVIRETLSLLEHQLRKNGIVVDLQLGAGSPLTTGNSGKLQQVFMNLFLNARDAMPDGGVLRVHTGAESSRVEIQISDTGSGISAENLKRIYDPFFTTKAVGKGTGLGLSVSYGIVQEHGGAISVESTPGEGTSFRIELPLIRKAVHV